MGLAAVRQVHQLRLVLAARLVHLVLAARLVRLILAAHLVRPILAAHLVRPILAARLVHLNRPKRRRGTNVRSQRPAIEENVTNDKLEWRLAKSTTQDSSSSDE